jgi:carbonic anhydrase
MKQENDRLKEIEEFFRTMQEKTEKYQKYFDALALLPQKPPPKRAYAKYRNSTLSPGEIENARLEPDSNRN